jgi:hypothetical protein
LVLAARQVEIQDNQIQREITDLILFLILQLQQVAVVVVHIGLVIPHIKLVNLEVLVEVEPLEPQQQQVLGGQEQQGKVTLVGKPMEVNLIGVVAVAEKMRLAAMLQVQPQALEALV